MPATAPQRVTCSTKAPPRHGCNAGQDTRGGEMPTRHPERFNVMPRTRAQVHCLMLPPARPGATYRRPWPANTVRSEYPRKLTDA
eukprot:14086588-Alexandrium_andersonii.AAC.1